MAVKKSHWLILLINLIYPILFGIHFYKRGNLEFVWYVFIIYILIGVFTYLHKKYNFNTMTLIGLTIWGIGHMFGGSTLLTENILYNVVLYPIFSKGGTTLFSYDHLLHFYFYVVMTSVIYQITRKYFKPNARWLPIAALIVFASMGVGAFNELVEFIPVLLLENTGVGGYYNVAWDIVFNTLGALVTIIYISWRRKVRFK